MEMTGAFPLHNPGAKTTRSKPLQQVIYLITCLSLCQGIVGDGLLQVTPWGIKTILNSTYDLLMHSHELAIHMLFCLLFFNLAVMVLHPITLRKRFKPYDTAPLEVLVPGEIELSVVMGSILALFLTFILIQFRYRFGGVRTHL